MKKLTFPFALLTLVAFSVPTRAGVIATDGDVPADMSTGGTAVDPAAFIIGVAPGYTRDFGSSTIYVGGLATTEASSYNALTIQNGSSVVTSTNTTAYVGYGSSSDSTYGNNNQLTVTGAGSTLTTRSLNVGYYGGGNSLVIEAGGSVITGGVGAIGYGFFNFNGYSPTAGQNNSATVTGVGSTWTIGSTLSVGNMGSGNTLSISDGGYVASVNSLVGFTASSDNRATVSGVGSLWATSGFLYVGMNGSRNSLSISAGARATVVGAVVLSFRGTGSNNSIALTGSGTRLTVGSTLSLGNAGSSGNTITLTDSSLFELTLSTATVTFGTSATNGINRLQVDHSYFAWAGDHTTEIAGFISDGRVSYFGSIWTTATAADVTNGTVTYAYYATAAAASAATGGLYTFTGTNGYTILTAVPEPSSYGVALAALLGGAIVLRRRQGSAR